MISEVKLAELRTMYAKLQENYAEVLKQRDEYLADLIAAQDEIKRLKERPTIIQYNYGEIRQ